MAVQNIARGNKALSWGLRIFLMLVILLFLMFSLDVFGSGRPFWEVVAGFLIHNVFTIAFLIILIVSWKREDIAGILLISAGIFMIFFFGGPGGLMYGTWIMIGLPVFVGTVFLFNYFLIGKNV